eukprot:CAMPEP_0202456810 /NCGR_PEP_ID=MMETSP1360-20130828/13980_1 /ASSEMBLY_ACC=CAM_ASM_000848 /TAXON_ID=515479 /ORGANISM="Licmophora paradoxa, Strain CCMP2313" /LENGTH=425 /DNA_ID=CAMNT_0049076729 /DNA_START=35 /DNA_END=1312 /DNA_ORIENTATION=+
MEEASSCQLIYSDGGETGLENLWTVFTIALAPYVLGLPPANVTLYLDESLVALSPDTREMVEKIPVPSGVDWLPVGYKEYFWQIHCNALDVKKVAEASPPQFRIIAGHGFHDFNGGHIRCGVDSIPFNKLGSNATVLTILDICNSPHAASVLSGTYPQDDPKTFKWKRAFRDPNMLIPIVCDMSATTWAFRIGFHEQNNADNDVRNWTKMTGPIGDAVTCSLLAAIQSFTESNAEGGPNLDKLFEEKYGELKIGYLGEAGIKPRRSFSKLSQLQSLIEIGTISVNQAALNCELFRRSDKWFLTTERAVEVLPDDTKLADCLIDYIVNSIKTWHEKNPDSLDEIEESRLAWKKVLKMLGPHRQRLQSKELEFITGRQNEQLVVASDDGIQLEAFAVSCKDLKKMEIAVRKWIYYGDPSTDESDIEP